MTYHACLKDHAKELQVAIKEIQITRGNDNIGTNEAWEQEAKALSNINDLDNGHIIKCVAAIRRGESRYFMFPWADGDSLRDYWDNTTLPGPSSEIIQQAIQQLRGLADALVSMHNGITTRRTNGVTSRPDEQENPNNPSVQILDENDEVTEEIDTSNPMNIRHGDLKPENILRFVGGQSGLGTLKIADMGLAKQHIVSTQDRTHLTSTRYGTIRYEAPETINTLNPRSRLYDIWSMGCITLEFVIWILYGNVELNNFYNQVRGDKEKHCQFFEDVTGSGGLRHPRVHAVVSQWIEHIETNDPECSQPSAIGDLLRIIKEKLLVVALSPSRASGSRSGRGFAPPEFGQTVTRYRATAVDFRSALDEILENINNSDYLHHGGDRSGVRAPLPPSDMLSPNIGDREVAANAKANGLQVRLATGVLTGLPGRLIQPADYTLPPLKDWQFNVDNQFAVTVRDEVGFQAMIPTVITPARLCTRCLGLQFWGSSFQMPESLSVLLDRAKDCDFCQLIVNTCAKSSNVKNDRFQIERKQSNLMMTGDPFPILSIFRSSCKLYTCAHS